METLYHWVGLIVVHAAVVFAALVAFYFFAALVAGLWQRFTYSTAGNRWFVVKDFAHYLFTGRARWQKALTHFDTRQMLSGWNNRNTHMARIRRIAAYRRSLLAWVVRRQRAANVLA